MQPDQPHRAQPGPWSATPGGQPPADGERPRHEPPPAAPQHSAADGPAGGASPPRQEPVDEPEVLVGEVLPPGTPLPHPPGQEPPDPRRPGGAPGYPPGPAGPPPSGHAAPPGTSSARGAEFSSNLGGAVGMFALFPPFALPATIDAVRARAAYRQGDRSLADDNAAESRRWSRSALVFGLVCWAFLLCCGGGGLVLHGCGIVG